MSQPLTIGLAPELPKMLKVLILGSLPGNKSIAEQQYYAHPRNAFWHIMSNVLSFELSLPYEKRLCKLSDANIGLWDVIDQAVRPGSLDSAIQKDKMQINNLRNLIEIETGLHLVLFNGKKAAEVFQRQVRPGLSEGSSSRIEFHTMPSTSPANAIMNPETKLAEWSKVLSPALIREIRD